MIKRRITFFLLSILVLLAQPYAARALSVEITATVPGCGDGIIGTGEHCDGVNLGGATCASLGFSSGVLSCSAVCTFNITSCSSIAPPSSGGSSGGSITSSYVVIEGTAYPQSNVRILKDGQAVVTTVTDTSGNFQAVVSGLSVGDYIFGIYAKDPMGGYSSLVTFPVAVARFMTTKLSGIIVSPSISVTPETIKQGGIIVFSGKTAPNATVVLNVDADGKVVLRTQADALGNYLTPLDTTNMESGVHTIAAYSIVRGIESAYSLARAYTIDKGDGTTTSQHQTNRCMLGDVNCDGRVNLIDLSIMLYWYKNPIPPANVDLNGDGVVNIVDFSMLMYRWTS